MPTNQVPENAQNAAPEWGAEKISELFAEYTNTIAKDQDDFGNHVRWRAYNEECTQLITEYGKRTPGNVLPTDPEGKKALAACMDELKTVIENYKKDRAEAKGFPKKPSESTKRIKKNPEKADIPEDFNWVEATNEVFSTYEMANSINAKRLGIDKTPQYQMYKKKADIYLDLYADYVKPSGKGREVVVADEKMVRTIVWEMRNLMNEYFPAKEFAADMSPEDRDAKLKKLFGIGSSIRQASMRSDILANIVIANEFMDYNASKNKKIDARQAVLNLSKMEDFAHLDKDKMKAILFLKAHIRDVGGKPMDGEDSTHFNRADIPSVAAALQQDLLHNRPADLYKDILEKRGETLTEEDKLGLRLMIDQYNGIDFNSLNRRTAKGTMLATYAEHRKFATDLQRLVSGARQIAEGQQKLNKGIGMVNMLTFRNIPISQRIFGRPLRNIIARKVTEGAGELARGKAEYFAGLALKTKFDTSKVGLPGMVQEGIRKDIAAGMDTGNIGPSFVTDTSARPEVTKELIDEIEKQAKVLNTVGEGTLDDLMLRSGMEISTATAFGLSEETLNWLLKAQNSKDVVSGIPAGAILNLKPLTEEKRKAILDKKNGKQADTLAKGVAKNEKKE